MTEDNYTTEDFIYALAQLTDGKNPEDIRYNTGLSWDECEKIIDIGIAAQKRTFITRVVMIDEKKEPDDLEEWLGPEPSSEPQLSPIEQTKKDIASLQQRLKLLEHQERIRTPCEKAYRDFYGDYPITDVSMSEWDAMTWTAFSRGYEAGKND